MEKTRHRCGQQEDRRRIRREAQEIGEIHKRKSGNKKKLNEVRRSREFIKASASSLS
jgi:hypothetical protein